MEKVAIVTGSNKGIGLAIVRGMCRQFKGHVYLTSRNTQLGEEAVKLLEGEGLHPKYHQLDITSEDSIAKLAVYMMEKYGGVDILINNAGVYYNTASTTAPAMEQATVTLTTNFTGTLNMMRAFVPLMKPHGRIVNVSSSLGTLSCLTEQLLRDKFSSPSRTEKELVSLMEQCLADVKDGKHKETGWGNSFYEVSKIGVNAMSKVFAREMTKSGEQSK